jgi:hypothetical protein
MLRVFVLRSEGHLQSLRAFIDLNWQALAKQEKPLQVVVSEFKAKRTLEQNAKMHAVFQEIAEKAWVNGRQYSAEVWKEEFKRTLLGTEDLPSGGKAGVSTTTLNVEACARFIDQVEAYAASELGVEFA